MQFFLFDFLTKVINTLIEHGSDGLEPMKIIKETLGFLYILFGKFSPKIQFILFVLFSQGWIFMPMLLVGASLSTLLIFYLMQYPLVGIGIYYLHETQVNESGDS